MIVSILNQHIDNERGYSENGLSETKKKRDEQKLNHGEEKTPIDLLL